MSRAAAVRLLVLLSLTVPAALRAQVSLTTIGTAYTQNFDSLATSGTTNAWADNSTIAGWYAQFALVSTNPTTYRADAGGSNTGAIYSWGTGTATERAFGSISSGTPGTILRAVHLVNNTGSSITSLDVSFFGEQWRAGGCTGTDCAPVAQKLDFQYQVANAGVITDANTPSTDWVDVDSLDFNTPTPGIATAAALDGNAAANRTALSATITVLVNAGQEIWLRWMDVNDANNDHGLGIDDFSVTPQLNSTPTLDIADVSQREGDSGTSVFTFLVELSIAAGPGGVTFDIATAEGSAQDDQPSAVDADFEQQTLTGQFIPEGSSQYSFDVVVHGDLSTETDETFFVNVTSIVGATAGDVQGQGTIVNDEVTLRIHDVQGNGSASPVEDETVVVQGIVTASFQSLGAAGEQLDGFFLQEEDAEMDADPNTSEGIFVFCGTCPVAVGEGFLVRVRGTVDEFFGMTEIVATGEGSFVLVDATGSVLPEATLVDLPVPAGPVDDFYERLEGMLVEFVDTLTVAEYFELGRFGHIELFEGGRPRQFTESSTPSVAGYAAHLEDLDRRRVILDDDDNGQNLPVGVADGFQTVYHPAANGGLSVGTQGIDFFRGGDEVSGLTGVLHWDFPGSGANAWRIRPTLGAPVAFTVANPRPATPPEVGGAIQAASINLLNYFTTIDVSSTGCAPALDQDCRGADSAAELDRQRARAALVICALDADVVAFMEVENTTASDTITDLLGAVNASCGSPDYVYVDTGGTLGTDAIRVALIYRSTVLAPVGSALVDMDPVHNRPPTAQIFDVVDAANPAFGERFTVIATHFKSKGCGDATGADLDAGDGAGCYNGARTDQAVRLLSWITDTVLPAAGEEETDVLMLGDFNSYPQELPIVTITEAGYSDLEGEFLGDGAYSYLFDGQLGHLDYALSSDTLTPQVTGVGAWHINADEIPLFDYNDEVRDVLGESAFEEKPDGSALVPPRVLYQPGVAARASDHDPVLVGLFSAGPSGDYFTVTPCRAVDTRSGSPLQSGVPSTFALHGVCGIPATAVSVVVNVTVVNPTSDGELTLHPADQTPPAFANQPFLGGRTRALIVVAALSSDSAGEIQVLSQTVGGGVVDLVLDVMGYFE